MRRIDSHHHFWVYDPVQYDWISDEMSVLRRDFLYKDLFTQIQRSDIAGVVSVQARQTTEETQALLEIGRANAGVLGVVGWIPLASDSIAAELEKFADQSLLKGFRHVVQDEPDDAFILNSQFNRGVAQLAANDWVYDILVFARQLGPTIEFVDLHPNQRFVLDHIAKPTIRNNTFDVDWEKNIRELAKRQNVMCKFSGVATEVRDATWSINSIRRYWDVALSSFGPERLMFGSDWPVCLLRTEYAHWVDIVSELARPLSNAEQAAFWSENATKAYRLGANKTGD